MESVVYVVIQTNCNGSVGGQTIKVGLFHNLKDAEKSFSKVDCCSLELDGINGYWDSKKQMFSYIEEKKIQ